MAKSKATPWLEPDGLLRLTAWARDGLTHEQIAHNCGIATGTLYEWLNRHPEIADALKKGKEVVDIEVENALYKRAMGYYWTEETVERAGDAPPKVKRVTRHVPGDVTAQIYWLKNRKPQQWRERKDYNATDDDETGVIVLAPVQGEDNHG